MIYNTYGSTGIKVSAIGFGGMRFPNQDDVDACASLVKAAYDADINYFDTSTGYGKSEELFGVALKEMRKTRKQKPFYIATKTMRPDPADVRRECETSLTRMGLDYIDFYHVWCVLTPDAYQERKTRGAIKEFEKLKSEGLIKHICVSTHMTGSDITSMLNDYPFEGILLGYSASNFAYREAGIETAAKLNRGVVAMNPLAGGVIPQNPNRFSFVKTRPDETVVEGALRFLLNDSRITVTLVGLSSKAQLAEAIRAVDGFKPISPATIEKIRGSLSEAFNELCTGCRYCDNCPQGIPVPQMMDAYNQYLLSGKSKDMLERLSWHWDIGLENEYLTKCTRCGQCEKACTQKLPICDRLKFIRDEAQKALASEKQKKS
jgi:predicted aldo/keto reductase-like oxidoreductase